MKEKLIKILEEKLQNIDREVEINFPISTYSDTLVKIRLHELYLDILSTIIEEMEKYTNRDYPDGPSLPSDAQVYLGIFSDKLKQARDSLSNNKEEDGPKED